MSKQVMVNINAPLLHDEIESRGYTARAFSHFIGRSSSFISENLNKGIMVKSNLRYVCMMLKCNEEKFISEEPKPYFGRVGRCNQNILYARIRELESEVESLKEKIRYLQEHPIV